MTTHVRPASFGTLQAGNHIPKGARVQLKVANDEDDNWFIVFGTLERSLMLAQCEETGAIIVKESALVRDEGGMLLEVHNILDWHVEGEIS